MTNNDILRRLRYIFDFNDTKMMALFRTDDSKATRAEISNWLKREEDEDYKNCNDGRMAIFLDGFISEKRGKKEGEQRPPEKKLNNNIVFNKLKIALNLKADDVLEIMNSDTTKLSKHELSAFFRKPGHKHYRECKDQFLRNFLQGLQQKHRPGSDDEAPFQWPVRDADSK
ncbi:MAG: DUF1456 family protein [Arenicellales bacterium]